jgi:hypothetical protein
MFLSFSADVFDIYWDLFDKVQVLELSWWILYLCIIFLPNISVEMQILIVYGT